jgi:hypothetical protein
MNFLVLRFVRGGDEKFFAPTPTRNSRSTARSHGDFQVRERLVNIAYLLYFCCENTPSEDRRSFRERSWTCRGKKFFDPTAGLCHDVVGFHAHGMAKPRHELVSIRKLFCFRMLKLAVFNSETSIFSFGKEVKQL